MVQTSVDKRKLEKSWKSQRRIRKRESGWSSLRWKSLNVGNNGDDTNNSIDNFDINSSENDARQGEDEVDLGDGGAGIFLGLEVVDGSLYEVKKDVGVAGTLCRILPVSDDANDDHVNEIDGSNDPKCQRTKTRKGKKSNKPQNEGTIEGDSDGTTDSMGKNEKAPHGSLSPAPPPPSSPPASPAKGMVLGKEESGPVTVVRPPLTKKEEEKRKKKNQKRKKKRQKAKEKKKNDDDYNENKSKGSSDEQRQKEEKENNDLQRIQTSWSVATRGVHLHRDICSTLLRSGFEQPTPVQVATLAASILGRRDIVGASPTGSGKTLCYVLPILQYIFDYYQGDGYDVVETNQAQHKNEGDNIDSSPSSQARLPLTGLVLCPTRELAIQVSREFSKFTSAHHNFTLCATIVGGLAEQKQTRVLDVQRPAVIVATPGRLWELMSSKEHPHLNDLSKLRYVVIDEADRMISQGGGNSFPELSKILDDVNIANPPPPTQDEIENELAHDDDVNDVVDEDRLKSLPGVRGESQVTMLDENMLRMINVQESKRKHQDGEGSSSKDILPSTPPTESMEIDDDEFERQQQEFETSHLNAEQEAMAGLDSGEDIEMETTVHRQTLIFSATLALAPSEHQNMKSSKDEGRTEKQRGKKKGKGKHLTVGGAIAEILSIAGARGQTKIIDMGSSSISPLSSVRIKAEVMQKKSDKNSVTESPLSKGTVKLPPGLSLGEIRCTQLHKDSHLYAFLIASEHGLSAGPCLVFCNSIAAVKRVCDTLKVLGLPSVRSLHAHMPQKSRLLSVDSLSRSNTKAIVIATDVAARGLDIPSVASVVHYDVARTVDTFVHRAGRTARGVGASAVGWSLSLVSANEEREHCKVCEATLGLGVKKFEHTPIDGRLLSASQERVSLASKIVCCETSESRVNRNNQWFVNVAADTDIDLDEDLLDKGLNGGSRKDQQHLLEARRAKVELKQLLSKPMRKQAFGKFLSITAASDVLGTVEHTQKRQKMKR